MQNWNRFPRALLVFSLLIVLCAGMFAPRVDVVEAKPLGASATNIVISEFRTRGPSGGNDEFIEIYNPTNISVDIGNWEIRVLTGGGTENTRVIITTGVILSAGQYYLVANNTAITGYSGSATPDQTYTTGIVDAGGVAIFDDLGARIDSVGLNTINTLYTENTPLATLTLNINQSYERKAGGTNGSCLDDENNSTDFALRNPSNPQNYSSPFTICGYAPLSLIINEVAWAGTAANDAHEWIEIYNPGALPIDLKSGWRLVATDGSPNIDFSTAVCATPNCTVPAGGYFLLERDTDGAISDIFADYVYTGALANGGESLTLYDPTNAVIDTANGNGGAWPAGNATTFSTMERNLTLPIDSDSAWYTNNGITRNGLDYNQDPIMGTPKLSNAPTSTPTPTNTSTPTSTSTLTPTITTTPSGARSVIINEIAWAGTTSGLSDDEWIELYNPGSISISLSGWSLKAADGDPNITFPSGASIPAGGYYLLERDDDNTVSDINADQTYTGTLSNSGEALTLYDAANKVIDTANGNGGAWPAGSSSTYGTMERISTSTESDSAWRTNTGIKRNGKNANGGDILGTPKSSNSPLPTPTPTLEIEYTDTPTPVPTFRPPDPRPIINEFLPRPGFDWNQDGKVNVFDEFIEIKNLTSIDINLGGWKLDDEANLGSSPYTIPDLILKPGQRVVFYALETNILLSDGGDTVRLLDPNGKVYDAYTYTIARAEDQSICRLPDGNVYNGWFEDCIPTPNLTNSHEGTVPAMPEEGYQSPVCQLPDTLPADFLFAECRGYGANIWNADYWDQPESSAPRFIPQNTSKWETILE
ncbi:MAG: lamin tail domain-containing protein [Anaerolineales bacterium]|nr:lamin tail domain-containing protein [Anaerolineales bacterium]